MKAYDDDLTTIININQQSHVETLRKVDSCCVDLDLQIRADKCVTYSFNGHKVDKRSEISLSSGDTQNISTSGTKVLGRYIVASAKQTSAISSTTVRSKFESALPYVPSDQDLYVVNTSSGFISITWPRHFISTSLSTQHRQHQSNKWKQWQQKRSKNGLNYLGTPPRLSYTTQKFLMFLKHKI